MAHRIGINLTKMMLFPGGSDSKEFTCNAGDPGLIPVIGRYPGEGNGNPLQLPGKFHGQRSLAGVHGITKSQT